MKPRETHIYMRRGDAKVFPFEVDEDITAQTFRFSARYAESDIAPIIDLKTSTGGVVVTDGAAGLAEIRIPPEVTSTIERPTVLLWDLEHDTGAGPQTILAGRLHVYPDIAHD